MSADNADSENQLKVNLVCMSRVDLADYLNHAGVQIPQNNAQHGLLVMKLTCFHDINIAFGYQVMEDIIDRFCTQIPTFLRPQDQLIRINESELAIFLPNIRNPEHAILAANRILAQLSRPFTFSEDFIYLTATIGIATMPKNAGTLSDLMTKADIALKQALDENTPYEVYTKLDEQYGAPSIKLTHDLKSAIAQNDLELFFQPKVDLCSGRICSVESLTRWYLEGTGYIEPELFISVAEHSGLISELTQWCLNVGFRQCRKWEDEYNLPLSMAVNISASILHDPKTMDSVIQSLDLWGVEPAGITLEVTESMMMQVPDKSLACLQRFRDLGIRLSIDDFGTGYSSLAYLKSLPVDELKIDKSFVKNMVNDEGDLTIVRSIIDLAKNFNLEVVAEGVENQASMDKLIELGCDYAQGYFIARPMNSMDMNDWLKDSVWGINSI